MEQDKCVAICGRRFKVHYYKTPYETNGRDMFANISYLEGTLENFNPPNDIVFIDEKYGFNIINYRSIVNMLEIKEV